MRPTSAVRASPRAAWMRESRVVMIRLTSYFRLSLSKKNRFHHCQNVSFFFDDFHSARLLTFVEYPISKKMKEIYSSRMGFFAPVDLSSFQRLTIISTELYHIALSYSFCLTVDFFGIKTMGSPGAILIICQRSG